MKIQHLFLIPSVLATLALGCASSDKKAADDGCPNNPQITCKAVSAAASMGADVSFKNDVFMPIMHSTCNSIVCHSTPPSQAVGDYPPAGLYLGPGDQDPDSAVTPDVLAQVVMDLQAKSKTAPTMNIVTPGDPASSFLMLKLSGCQNTASLACTVQSKSLSETKTGCGDTMPPTCAGLPALTDAQVATFARWIAQGAKNN